MHKTYSTHRSKLTAINASTRAYEDFHPSEDSTASRAFASPPRVSKLRRSRSQKQTWTLPRTHPPPPQQSSVLRNPTPGASPKLFSSPSPSEVPAFSISIAWFRLSPKFRIFLFAIGFVVVYYYMFAKHHQYDREITAIHEDVQKLLQETSVSGFLHQQFVEADLPPIFRESDLLPLPGNGTNSSATTTAARAVKPNSEHKKTSMAPDSGPSDHPKGKAKEKGSHGDLPLQRKKRKKEKKKKKKKKKKKRTKSIEGDKNASEKNSTQTLHHSNPDNLQSTSTSTQEGTATISVSPSLIASASPPPEFSPTIHSTEKQVEASPIPSSKASPIPSSSTSMISDGSKENTTAPGAQLGSTTPIEEIVDFSKFKDLTINDVPKGMIPVLNWNYDRVDDPNTTEQVFGLGNKLDHVAAYKPLCLDTNSSEAFAFEGQTVCGGYNRTVGWLIQYCEVMRESLYKEYLLETQPNKKPLSWLQENEADIEWVEGVTVLQILEKNCGNIAHFAGRLLLLQHIMENIPAYVSSSRVDQVLILPTYHIMKRFLYPHNYEFWHKTLLSALLAPSEVAVGTLGNFLYRMNKKRDPSVPVAQLLHNFSLADSSASEKKFVCFRKAIVPGYLKARFFVNDMEYPSMRPSLQSKVEGAPHVPRDSLRMRERISALVKQNPVFSKMRREILLLDRDGSRRVFDSESKAKITDLFMRLGKERGYEFKVVNFAKKTFSEQYDIVNSAAIAIGIHGANLVNTMFMPPLAVLIELFPFGFSHEMYVNGGNAGLKYYGYEMKTGTPFERISRYRSVTQCIKYDKNCKLHYRDGQLQVTDEDMKEIERILERAIVWCEKTSFKAESSIDIQNKTSNNGSSSENTDGGDKSRRRLLSRKKKRKGGGRGKGMKARRKRKRKEKR
ncbi:Protein O-linked-mannose beta-1,4-N-acetylglucosaminyltransferase 2 [Gracilariopsis chorda]|uniref:Protein O-linked-mannose beta-1,4-N-acetylglucosaminyltransferase 2 n=1 Tax=Gracilariopsis chorda TaxID=448386 RepID=A0A2V3IFN5_9FLOR|nr:Protein O-linked-mannose beta-1,4-N-acetylglucosaminyltransferase 2 [Gracilariopsis chorda]|eukprot:PXF40838.1 Protein O-linked-mannose beta-1,4-N-acetylglucosaminyltransferase 2 [Gracilariopsis chorda]